MKCDKYRIGTKKKITKSKTILKKPKKKVYYLNKNFSFDKAESDRNYLNIKKKKYLNSSHNLSRLISKVK
jgi:hypothetical protein